VGTDIRSFPTILKYMEKHKEKLEQRDEARKGQMRWYQLRPCDYYAAFEKPKIISARFMISPLFAWDDEGYYANDACYILPTEDLYLVGLLNSNLMWFVLSRLVTSVQADYSQIHISYLNRLPIAQATPPQRAAIEALVRKLLGAKGQGPQVAKWEQELNALVYKLYGLTKEEIKIVEGGA
jgi:hypothetical protein